MPVDSGPSHEPMQHPGHTSVLLDEVLACLRPQPGERAFDGTLGCGGHALAVAERLGPTGALLGVDRDGDALEAAAYTLQRAPCEVVLLRYQFDEADLAMEETGWDRVDIALLDLGICSTQVDNPQRGFSFKRDGPLDMRMDRRLPISATDIVNDYDEAELYRILRTYGEERAARRIARAICRARASTALETTSALRDVVCSVLGSRSQGGIDPATRTFQALRIAVNRELESLETGLSAIWGRLSTGGRLAVISYHSLEDRIVKRFFRDREGKGVDLPPGFPVELPTQQEGVAVTRKPIRPGTAECRNNPRARSAKLRAIEKTAGVSGEMK